MFFILRESDNLVGGKNGNSPYSEGSIDSTLSSDGVTSGREELGNAGGLETSFCKTKGSTETSPTSPSKIVGMSMSA
jgi:hypothetical protein